ncbi:helix-turn-helix domain-containing protein [Mariprofundus aestuarium]|uniref:helix-turn-helix domain-containing protein n=1 Tax=Mariprofundus aestuarium TaxID=1921086 RepID=UPI000C22819A
MSYRTRIKYTPEQKSEIWDRWKRGESLKAIGQVFDRGSSSIYGQLSPTGGIRPTPRRRATIALSLSEREEISRGIAAKQSMRWIASRLDRPPSTICREI